MTPRKSANNGTSDPFQRIAALATDAIYVHRDGKILWANESAEHMFGATAQRPLVGACAWDLIAPYDREQAIAIAGDLEPTDPAREVSITRQRLDGTPFPSEAYATAVAWEDGPATYMLIRDLSEASRLKQRLAEVTAREIDIAEVSPDAMLIHLQGEIVFVNRAACRMFRAETPDQLIGRDVLDLVHPESRGDVRANWAASASGVIDDLIEMRRLRLDGTDFIGEARHRIVTWQGKSGFLVNIRDSTPRIKTQTALEQNEAQLRSLLDALPDTVFAHISRKIVFANRTAGKMFGTASPDDLIGLDMLDLVHPDDAQTLAANWENTEADDGQKQLTLRRRRIDGTYFLGEAHIIKKDWKGEHGHLVVIRDVTEQVAADRKLQAAREEAERANEAKSRYFAGVSHELRSPLNAILGFSETIAHEMFGPVGNEHYVAYARDIHLSGQHLLSLIDDLLDLSKAESGEYQLNKTEFDLVDAVADTVRMMAPLADKKSLALSINKAPEALPVEAGEREIRQILMNLLSNAVKFTPEYGRIEIRIATDTHTGIRVSVADTGTGIANEDIPKLFEAYRQAQNMQGPNEQKGTGLGLTLSKRLAELHGGDIELESAIGKGTIATLILPESRCLGDAAS